ncbi:Sir2 family NAD-dependent protein deacetylase [Polaromonas sp.]|uniref:SIR2 family NAD-dependent protein deacylase n=1 Tax=Polaromonas sp. TaxID=1869339 RepID=UPI002730974B|nr:Sir2 family NAD-dependent protein deacetylase [Polaromonas sp.]MDP1740970.1 Sir2 family NAD-dependent protein deacetylase [Polaromonas sp.]
MGLTLSASCGESKFRHAADVIYSADALVIAAGAGIGVDSGLPDFRGNGGFWRAYPALAKANLNFAEVASPHTFEHNPSLAWGFYGHRLALYRKTAPHAGFDILKRWSEHMALGARIFTSNVDGQFQKAGFSEDQIRECHGSIHHLQCINECRSGVWRADNFEPELDVESCRLLNPPPRCPQCGALARPNVLMFNDWNWITQRTESQARRESKWLETITESQARVVVVEIGAGTSIPSVRHFSHRISHEFDGCIIRINPREPQVPSSRDIGIGTGSQEALHGIDTLLHLG